MTLLRRGRHAWWTIVTVRLCHVDRTLARCEGTFLGVSVSLPEIQMLFDFFLSLLTKLYSTASLSAYYDVERGLLSEIPLGII